MPSRDRRTVGELLADCDGLARETLLDVSAQQAPAMLRTFGQVVQSAARLWSVLPPATLAPASEPDVMVRLQALGRGIGRSAAGQRWPGPGPADERLTQIADSFERAASLVQRYGRQVAPTTPEVRADIAAARGRVMHTVYVAAHGTGVALIGYQRDILDRSAAVIRRHGPVSERPNLQHAAWAGVMVTRLGVFEQLAGGYVAVHPVTQAALGEVAEPPQATRLESVLAAWDIQAHRTLAGQPDPPDLERVARVQALIATVAGVVTEAAANTGAVDAEVVVRFGPLVESSQVAWTQVARRWSELRSPASGSDPLLARAAGEVRAAVGAAAYTQTGWATPRQLAGRVNLPRTLTAVQQAMVASVDVAYLAREVAAANKGFTASPRAAARHGQHASSLAPDAGRPERGGVAGPGRVSVSPLVPLPEAVRQGVVHLADDVIEAVNKAVAATGPLNFRSPAPTDKPVSEGRGRPAANRELPRTNPNVGGPAR